MPWGIAKVDERGEFKEWLVIPKHYENTITFIDENGNQIREETLPFKTAGILWIFDYKSGMFIGGDKAPGSSVAAPLNLTLSIY